MFSTHQIADGPQIVIFDRDISSGRAYDITQTSDEIQIGAVLIVASERVVGVLVGAWPGAVSVNHGDFHGLLTDLLDDEDRARYGKAIELAQRIAFILDGPEFQS